MTALSGSVFVFMVRAPAAKLVADEMVAVAHMSLNSVTVAASLNVNATVGVKFVVLGDVDCTLTAEKLGA